jgi:hypothetical protein
MGTEVGIVGNLEGMLEPAVIAELLDAMLERFFMDGLALFDVRI